MQHAILIDDSQTTVEAFGTGEVMTHSNLDSLTFDLAACVLHDSTPHSAREVAYDFLTSSRLEKGQTFLLAFASSGDRAEVAKMLRFQADRIEAGMDCGAITDDTGDLLGSFQRTEE